MIVTGDRDAFQLVEDGGARDGDRPRDHRHARSTTARRVIDRYGIPPELVPDFIGLKGDTSDNIPGVPGIGDKTAAQLLQQYGDLEGVLAHIDDISGAKRKENLREHADHARISKELATLQRDIDVGTSTSTELRRPRARPLAAARGVPRVRAARPAAAARGGARRGRGGRAERRASGRAARGARRDRRRRRRARRRCAGDRGGARAERRRAGRRTQLPGVGDGRAAAASGRPARRRARSLAGEARDAGRGRLRGAGATGRSSRTTGRRSPVRRARPPSAPPLGARHAGRRLPDRPGAARLPARRAGRGGGHRRRRSTAPNGAAERARCVTRAAGRAPAARGSTRLELTRAARARSSCRWSTCSCRDGARRA